MRYGYEHAHYLTHYTRYTFFLFFFFFHYNIHIHLFIQAAKLFRWTENVPKIFFPNLIFPSRCHSEHVKHLRLCMYCVCACIEWNTIDDDFIGSMSKARFKPPSFPEFFGGAAIFWFCFVLDLYAAASTVSYDKSNPNAFAFMVITHTLLYCVYEDYELTKSNRMPRHTNTLTTRLAQSGGTHTHTHYSLFTHTHTQAYRTYKHSQVFFFRCYCGLPVCERAEIARAVCAHCCKTQNIHTAVAE